MWIRALGPQAPAGRTIQCAVLSLRRRPGSLYPGQPHRGSLSSRRSADARCHRGEVHARCTRRRPGPRRQHSGEYGCLGPGLRRGDACAGATACQRRRRRRPVLSTAPGPLRAPSPAPGRLACRVRIARPAVRRARLRVWRPAASSCTPSRAACSTSRSASSADCPADCRCGLDLDLVDVDGLRLAL